MDPVRLTVIGILVVLLSNGDAGTKKVLKRSKRNHVSCRPKSLVRYRLTLHTLWSRETFPKMYPTYRPHAQWSSVVGRTHGSEHQMWKEGDISSKGVQMFAELGDPSQLNIESFQGYDDILDSFVAPPMNISVGQTSAVIILDGHHSKLSFMMKIIPSPDWFIGVSSLDLCAHGHWRNKVQVDLRPFDAGTDQGLTFTAPNWPNSPALPISAITSSVPDHPASSFLYPEHEELPRLAFLELDIVSEFRHRETFMNVPRHYTPFTAGIDATGDNMKTRSDQPSSTTVEVESKIPNLPQTLSKRHGGGAAVGKNNDHSANEDFSAAVNVNRLSETRWVRDNEEQVPEIKGRMLTTKDRQQDTVYIHGKHGATSRPLTHNGKQTNEFFRNALSGTVGEDTQHMTEAQNDNSFDRSTKTQIDTTNAGTDQSEVEPHAPEIKYDGQNVKTSMTSGIILGSDRALSRPSGLVSTPHTRSVSSVDQGEPLIRESPSQQMGSVFGSSSVDCEVGEWSEWSPCSQTCGFGQQERSRNVLKYPRDGGASCPRIRQTNWCGSMRNCEWNHFSFLESNVTKRQLREGLTRRRTVQRKKTAERLH